MNQLVRKVRIAGTGSFVPSRIVTNHELSGKVDTTHEWIVKNLGIHERRIAGPEEKTSDLAFQAGANALEMANIKPEEVDLIIVATATPDRLAPSTACIVQDKLKAYNAVAFDISAVCSGFLYAMSIGSQFIASGVYDRVLVIGADTMSKFTNWNDRSCVFFGDGAGAALLTQSNSQHTGFLAFRLYANGSGKFNFTIPGGGSEFPSNASTLEQNLHHFRMNGKAVYETGTQVLPKAIEQVLKDTGLSIDEIDYLIPHQPSINILKKTAELIGMPFEKVMTNMDKYANTTGGTVPLLLDQVNRSGRLVPGKHVLFAAVGSGWTWGAAIVKWS